MAGKKKRLHTELLHTISSALVYYYFLIFQYFLTQKYSSVPTLLLWSSLAAEEAGKLSHSRSLEQLVVIDLAIDLILCSAPRGAH